MFSKITMISPLYVYNASESGDYLCTILPFLCPRFQRKIAIGQQILTTTTKFKTMKMYTSTFF